jgi:hypothetical protein
MEYEHQKALAEYQERAKTREFLKSYAAAPGWGTPGMAGGGPEAPAAPAPAEAAAPAEEEEAPEEEAPEEAATPAETKARKRGRAPAEQAPQEAAGGGAQVELLGLINDNIVQLGVDLGKIGNDIIDAIEKTGDGDGGAGGGGSADVGADYSPGATASGGGGAAGDTSLSHQQQTVLQRAQAAGLARTFHSLGRGAGVWTGTGAINMPDPFMVTHQRGGGAAGKDGEASGPATEATLRAVKDFLQKVLSTS